MSTTRNPYNVEQIPNWWQITHDPRNRHAGEVQLAYYRDDTNADPDCIIHIERNGLDLDTEVDNRYRIEVQDRNADGPSMGTLLPVAINEPYDSQMKVEERLIELAQEYPLSKTLSP